MKIDAYSFGSIVIAGKTYTSDVIIFPDRVFSPWWRQEGHNLCKQDLQTILQREKPRVLIIGKGYAGIMNVPRALVKELQNDGLQVIVDKTPAAVEIFNAQERAGVVAALHLTC